MLKRIYGDDEEGLQEFTRPTSRAWLGWIGALCAVLLVGQWWFHRFVIASDISVPPVPVLEVRFSPESAKPGEVVRVELTARAVATSTAERLEWLMPVEFHPATSTEWRSLTLPAMNAGGEWKWSGEGVFAVSDATSSAFTLVRLKGGEAALREMYAVQNAPLDGLSVQVFPATKQNLTAKANVQWSVPEEMGPDTSIQVVTKNMNGVWDRSRSLKHSSFIIPIVGSSTVAFTAENQATTTVGEVSFVISRLYGGDFVPIMKQVELIRFEEPLVTWSAVSYDSDNSLFIEQMMNRPLSLAYSLAGTNASTYQVERFEWKIQPINLKKGKTFQLDSVDMAFALTTSTKSGIVTIRSENLSLKSTKRLDTPMTWDSRMFLKTTQEEPLLLQIEESVALKDKSGKRVTVTGPIRFIQLVQERVTW